MFGETPLHLIQTDAALCDLAARLRGLPCIGVDTESDGFHRYQEKVSLVQISDADNDYIIDPLMVSDMSPLKEVFADPQTLKIMHGADYDIVSLRRDFAFQINSLFDTMIAAQFLGAPRVGLADLNRNYFGVELDKQYQRHDWSARPLLQEHLDYARGDTHWLLALREVLTLKLRRVGRLAQVEEECLLLTQRQWQGRSKDPNDFMRIKGIKLLDTTSLKVLRALYRYREQQAEYLDRPAFKVLPEDVLVGIATQCPRNLSELAATFRPHSPLMRRHGEGLMAAVLEGLADETPLPPPTPRTVGPAPVLSARDSEILLLKLRDWRNAEMTARNLPAVAIASNGLLKGLTRDAPNSLDELAATPEIRQWQIAEFGEKMLEIIASVVESPPPSPGRKKRGRRKPVEPDPSLG